MRMKTGNARTRGTVRVAGTIALGLALAACTEDQTRRVLPPGMYVDTFQQVAASKIDVLWVVDNSPSMVQEQDNIAANFSKFLGFLTRARTDFHIGVTTTDVAGNGGKLVGNPAVITTSTPDPAGAFDRNVHVGVGGAALEKGLDAARRTFELNPPGFMRTDAYLYVIFVSDEDDHSEPGLPKYYYRYFKGLKGKGFEGTISAAAIGGDVPDGCDSPAGAANPASRYKAVVDQMGGQFGSICAASFEPMLNQLGIDAAGLKRKFNLSRAPDPPTLEVTVRYPCDTPAAELQASCTATQNQCSGAAGTMNCRGRPLPENGADGWTFESSSNTVVFHGAAVPPKGAAIEATYYLPGEAPQP